MLQLLISSFYVSPHDIVSIMGEIQRAGYDNNMDQVLV